MTEPWEPPNDQADSSPLPSSSQPPGTASAAGRSPVASSAHTPAPHGKGPVQSSSSTSLSDDEDEDDTGGFFHGGYEVHHHGWGAWPIEEVGRSQLPGAPLATQPDPDDQVLFERVSQVHMLTLSNLIIDILYTGYQ